MEADTVSTALKFILAAIVLLGLGVGFFNYASNRDQAHFRAAKNPCERECIQDSGGPDFCRKLCAEHPQHYP